MSVIIKGMGLPKNCRKCLMREPLSDYCELLLRYLDREELNGRDRDCPLMELPEKHGRLVDADAYVSMMEGKCDYEKALDPYVLSVCRGGIKLMPTIVEAEGAEDE